MVPVGQSFAALVYVRLIPQGPSGARVLQGGSTGSQPSDSLLAFVLHTDPAGLESFSPAWAAAAQVAGATGYPPSGVGSVAQLRIDPSTGASAFPRSALTGGLVQLLTTTASLVRGASPDSVLVGLTLAYDAAVGVVTHSVALPGSQSTANASISSLSYSVTLPGGNLTGTMGGALFDEFTGEPQAFIGLMSASQAQPGGGAVSRMAFEVINFSFLVDSPFSGDGGAAAQALQQQAAAAGAAGGAAGAVAVVAGLLFALLLIRKRRALAAAVTAKAEDSAKDADEEGGRAGEDGGEGADVPTEPSTPPDALDPAPATPVTPVAPLFSFGGGDDDDDDDDMRTVARKRRSVKSEALRRSLSSFAPEMARDADPVTLEPAKLQQASSGTAAAGSSSGGLFGKALSAFGSTSATKPAPDVASEKDGDDGRISEYSNPMLAAAAARGRSGRGPVKSAPSSSSSAAVANESGDFSSEMFASANPLRDGASKKSRAR